MLRRGAPRKIFFLIHPVVVSFCSTSRRYFCTKIGREDDLRKHIYRVENTTYLLQALMLFSWATWLRTPTDITMTRIISAIRRQVTQKIAHFLGNGQKISVLTGEKSRNATTVIEKTEISFAEKPPMN